MRRQAKPFTIEIRKSRKSSSSAQPLLGNLGPQPEQKNDSEGTAAMIAARKLFASPPVMTTESKALPPSGAPGAAAANPESRTRILPDLSWSPPAAVEPAEDRPRSRGKAPAAGETSPRAPSGKRRGRPPRAAQPKLFADEPVFVFGDDDEDETPRPTPRPIRVTVRRRVRPEPALRAGERWKRRLPPALW